MIHPPVLTPQEMVAIMFEWVESGDYDGKEITQVMRFTKIATAQRDADVRFYESLR